jgi:hypothetical protein
MKLNHLLLAAGLLGFTALSAQNAPAVRLRSATLYPQWNIRQSYLDSFSNTLYRLHQTGFALLQFNSLPSAEDRKWLSGHGIELLDYLPDLTYTATISGELSAPVLNRAGVRSVFSLAPQQKMDSYLGAGRFPSWAVKQPGTVDVWISFPKSFSLQQVRQELQLLNIEVIGTTYGAYRILALRLPQERVAAIASLPLVEFMQAAPAGDQTLNFNSRAASGATTLNASTASGGRGLNGEGVVIGVGDNADIQNHVDFSGRLISRVAANMAAHGNHVSGTVGGAGIINELFRGFAPKATLIKQYFSGILSNAATYVQDYGMVITNNSYGDVIECDYYGNYDLISRIMDQMAYELPSLSNVFAAGNSGGSTCLPYAPGFRTVFGGYQSAKNVITVGATTDSGALGSFSSRGPVRDGRTKPEIVSMGQRVASTWPTNIYSFNNGTSMAAPAVSGGLALLYQRYRQLNGGANPKNGLMKALLCNGAADRGNTGPDYGFGFGWMNLLRSVEMLEGGRHFTASATQGGNNTHTITVPAGTAQVKVLLYWNDPAATPLSARTLVNDLDLEVVTPGGTVVLPGILDTAVARVSNLSTPGVDRINNMEQVVISTPVAGTYTLRVRGTAIAQNSSQEYFLVYDVLSRGMRLTAPAGGEGLVPGEQAKIVWEANDLSGTGTLAFSPDNGASWTPIATGIALNRLHFSWWVPSVATSQALVRLTADNTGEVTVTAPFTIITPPVVSLAPVQCDGYVAINWNAVAGATDYEVMRLSGDAMQTIAITTGTSHTFSGLSRDSVYWVTVRARVGGRGGRRSIAVSRQPNSGSCAGAISDNDLRIDALLSPRTGRRFTSSQPGNGPVQLRIRNLDDALASSFTVSYSLNGGTWITETNTQPVNAGATYDHSFSQPADLTLPGSYTLRVAVTNAAPDGVRGNDTLTVVVRHLDNAPLNLATFFTDNFETAAPATYQRDTMGLSGIERYDFSPASAFGRARTFLNTGIAFSGNRALTLDADRFVTAGVTNQLSGTYNLGNYTTEDLRLDFRYLNHSNPAHASNRLFVRGSDTQPWIEAYDLSANQGDAGQWVKSESIELTRLLAGAGQVFTPSFQARWGQWGRLPATDREYGAGYTLDDIRVYQVFNDLQLKAVEAPGASSCGLSAATPVRIAVRNSASTTLTAIPLRYRVNNGAWVTETLSSIAPSTTQSYTFSTPANLAAFGAYTIQAVVDLPADSFRDNDTLTVVVRNAPVISQFPYLQTFEEGEGNWYAGGKRSSWQYGTPASAKINRAASGSKAWKTGIGGNYNDNERSYLYSPCFDLTGLANPTLSFSTALDIEDCGNTLCDGGWMEYSADGITWTKLGAAGSGTNWYNKPADGLWSVQNYTNWHVATIALPTGLSRLRLRFVMSSDPGVTREGIAVDDIHIYDNTAGIYEGNTVAAPVAAPVSGTGWTHFTSGGKLLASVAPQGQNLGTTAVQAFIFQGAVRNANNQYYHHRSLTVKPANRVPSDSVTVRFYFLDSEVDSLLRATGCTGCSKPANAYELGISKYTDPDPSFENGSLSDNQQGTWQFLPAGSFALVPFDKGYYAEFRVKDFSEFWLSGGGFDRSTPLPVKLMDFTAQKAGVNVVLGWKVGGENNVLRYEVELARGAEALQAARWEKIGETPSLGATTATRNYSLTDSEADKFGMRFYRLKVINGDGSFSYSLVRSVSFEAAVLWQVYPNPSNGLFFLVYQLSAGEVLEARVLDAKGSLLKTIKVTANGNPQKLVLDLKSSIYAIGVYMLQLRHGGQQQAFRLYKSQ